jgi:CHAD domain-containing protein
MRPRPADRLVERLKQLQDVLGDHQDATVTQHLLRQFGLLAYADGENAFSYGLLHARQREAGELILAELPAARRRAGRRKVRRWLKP